MFKPERQRRIIMREKKILSFARVPIIKRNKTDEPVPKKRPCISTARRVNSRNKKLKMTLKTNRELDENTPLRGRRNVTNANIFKIFFCFPQRDFKTHNPTRHPPD